MKINKNHVKYTTQEIPQIFMYTYNYIFFQDYNYSGHAIFWSIHFNWQDTNIFCIIWQNFY